MYYKNCIYILFRTNVNTVQIGNKQKVKHVSHKLMKLFLFFDFSWSMKSFGTLE